jgi:hypothetical protein
VESDLRNEFWELWCQLFNDKDTLKSEFIEAYLLAVNGLGL